MTEEDGELTVAQRLGRLLDRGLLPAGGPPEAAERLIDRAKAANATLEEYALTAGCIAISKTVPGEKYQASDGTWQTRTAAPPARDPRCP